jgi:aryl-alcohol dehydrogenase-like predicted oxidoreductase
MQQRPLGNTGLSVSALGLGCARIGALFQGGSRRQTLDLVRRCLDAGITFYDTADMYVQGESERLLGEAFRGKRDQVVIASKVGYRFGGRGGFGSRVKPVLRPLVARLGLRRHQLPSGMVSNVSNQDFSADYITRMLEDTLTRLGTDYLDVYQLHSPPPEVLSQGDFVPVLERLRDQGKIRHWGIACERVEDVPLCLRYSTSGTIQVSLSVLHPEAVQSAIPMAAQRGVGVIARQVYASGYLTRPASELTPDQAERMLEVRRAADGAGRSLLEFALDFSLSQPGVSVVLVGMYRNTHLDETQRYLRKSPGVPASRTA